MGIGGLAPLIDQLTSYLLHSPNYIFSIFSGLNDKNSSIVIWNSLETNEQKKKRFLSQNVPTCGSVAWSLLFSPDGRFLASAFPNNRLIIWSTEVRNKMGIICNRREKLFGQNSLAEQSGLAEFLGPNWLVLYVTIYKHACNAYFCICIFLFYVILSVLFFSLVQKSNPNMKFVIIYVFFSSRSSI